MVSALFLKVPREKRELVKTIYDRAAREIGDVPIVVANDGDVTALAGAMGLECGSRYGHGYGYVRGRRLCRRRGQGARLAQ